LSLLIDIGQIVIVGPQNSKRAAIQHQLPSLFARIRIS
jgi:hypothetical protein